MALVVAETRLKRYFPGLKFPHWKKFEHPQERMSFMLLYKFRVSSPLFSTSQMQSIPGVYMLGSPKDHVFLVGDDIPRHRSNP